MSATLYWSTPNEPGWEPCKVCHEKGKLPCSCGEAEKQCTNCRGEGGFEIGEHTEGLCDENIGLRHSLIRKYHINCEFKATLDSSDLPYLEGLRDGGQRDAQVLIKAIEEHGMILVGLGC